MSVVRSTIRYDTFDLTGDERPEQLPGVGVSLARRALRVDPLVALRAE